MLTKKYVGEMYVGSAVTRVACYDYFGIIDSQAETPVDDRPSNAKNGEKFYDMKGKKYYIYDADGTTWKEM